MTTLALIFLLGAECKRAQKINRLRARPEKHAAELSRRELLEPPLIWQRLWYHLLGYRTTENAVAKESEDPTSTSYMYRDDDLK
eukprot:108732-Prymnesium_polylepis.1